MPWETPTVDGFGRGLMTRIPDKGYSGWMCYFNGEFAEKKYDCKAVYEPNGEIGGPAPDFKWDENDLERGFRCEVVNKGDFDVAECLMFLPVEMEDYRLGEYRWSPYEEEDGYNQMGIVANGNPGENYYVQLGPVIFSGAITVSLGVATASLFAATFF